jgi:hypothetical protein
MHSLEAVLRTLLDRKWVVLLAPKETGGFITCDHPVCLMFSDPKKRGGFRPVGHGLMGTEVIFPVSRRMAVVGAFELQEDTVTLSDDWVAWINGALVAYANRQVYAADPRFTYSRQNNEKPRMGVSLVKDALFLKKSQRK